MFENTKSMEYQKMCHEKLRFLKWETFGSKYNAAEPA